MWKGVEGAEGCGGGEMAPGLREMLAEALLLAGFGNVTEYGGVVQRGFRGLQAGPKCDQ